MEDYRKSKIETQNVETHRDPKPRSRALRWMVAALVVVIAMSLALGYSLYQMQYTFDASLQDLNDQISELQDTLPLFAKRIDQQHQQLGVLSTEWEVVQGRIGVTEKDLAESKALAENLKQEQERSLSTLAGQIVTKANLADLEDLKAQSSGRFEQVDAKLSGVEENVGRNLRGVEKTWQELAQLGVRVTEQGNLIATSMAGIRQLEQRGERDYFEFNATLYRPFRVGDVTVELRDTNRGKNRAKLRLSFDDKRIVRSRVATNQPLTLYVGRDRVPYEVVINDVDRGRIWGYVSVPVAADSVRQIARVNGR